MTWLALSDGWSLEWGAAEAALEGESGDFSVVRQFDDGALIAVIDGLGHGPEAREAARSAAGVLEDYCGAALEETFVRCHEATRGTRGAVMTLASFSTAEATLAWCGVGNVEAVLFREDPHASPPREAVASRGGVVGYQLPPIRVTSVRVSVRDVLVMVTDGIRSDFEREMTVEGAAADIAGRVLQSHARGTDDALVIVARFLRGQHGS